MTNLLPKFRTPCFYRIKYAFDFVLGYRDTLNSVMFFAEWRYAGSS